MSKKYCTYFVGLFFYCMLFLSNLNSLERNENFWQSINCLWKVWRHGHAYCVVEIQRDEDLNITDRVQMIRAISFKNKILEHI